MPKIYYTYNEIYFDVVDTPIKAYYLGLLYADGCLNSDRHRISIGLISPDKYILEKLRSELKTDKKLYYRKSKDYYYLNIDNVKLYNALIKQGLIPRKTNTIKFPNLKEHLIKHFILGYFDGDGCLTNYGKKKKFSKFSFVCNENISSSLKTIFKKELNINFYEYKKYEPNIVELLTGGNYQILKACSWLYNDAVIYMKRKYEKYLEIIEKVNNAKLHHKKYKDLPIEFNW